MTAFDWQSGGFVVADGKRLEAAAFGPPPDVAPTLMLLHEGLGSLGLWRDFPERLAAATGLGVFVYSRAGYGRSDTIALPRPLVYLEREARSSLPQVLDAIGFRQGVLVGHSDGASISVLFAGDRVDERVKGLVLMAPHVFTEKPGLAEIAVTRRAYESGDLRARLGRWHDDVDAAFLGWSDTWLNPAFEPWNIEASLARWRVPALVIQGADDQYASLQQVWAIKRGAPALTETLVLENCRHAPQFEQPERTLSAIAGFCAKALGGTT